LYEQGHHVLAAYVAGLAVECIFRAYHCRVDPEFDSRHDLAALFEACGFEQVLPPDRMHEYNGYVGTITSQWSNNHRYRSKKALRAYWKRMRVDRKVREGDFVKESTRRMVRAARELVAIGAQRWQQ
jgi:hypothetical protein